VVAGGDDRLTRLAIVGCGPHSASQHAASLVEYARRNPGSVELVAACDLNIDRAESFRKRFGFQTSYSDLEKLVQSERLDGIISVVPIPFISEVGTRLLQLGIPCSIEKPLGDGPEAWQALFHEASATGTPHIVSCNRRFLPHLNQALDWAREIGPIEYFRLQMHRVGRKERDFLFGTGIHVIDAARYIGGDVTEQHVTRLRQDVNDVPWYRIALTFASGCQAEIEILPTTGRHAEVYDLFGNDFHAQVTAPLGFEGAVWRLRCSRLGKLEIDETFDVRQGEHLINGAFHETVEFVEQVTKGQPTRASISDVLPSVKLSWNLLAEATGRSGVVGA